jgi:hypothetical protein
MRQVLFIVSSIVKKSVMQFSQKLYFLPSQHQGWNRFGKLMLHSIQKIYDTVVSHIGNMNIEASKCEVSYKNYDLYNTCSMDSSVEKKYGNHVIPSPPSTNTGSTKTTDQRLSNQPLKSLLIAKPHTFPELGTIIDYPLPNPMQSQNYKSSFIGQPHAIPELQIMPNPMPALETDTVPVPTLPPFAPNSDSPSRETHVGGTIPEEHGELSRKELIELFGEENMNYIFELRAQIAALTVLHPSPDRGKQLL